MTLDPGEEQGKLRGGYPGAETRPTRTLAAGDRVGSLEVLAAPGHTPGPDRLPRHARPHALLRRRLRDARRRGDHREALLALPAARARHLAPPDRAGVRAGAARARPRAPRARARQGRRVARRRRWTPRSRAGAPEPCRAAGSTARRSSTRPSTLADADGLEAVTLARVAHALGVKPPSLYNHVDGRDGLVRAIALRGLGELTDALRRAATGRAGADALAGRRPRPARLRARAPRPLRRHGGGARAGGRGAHRRGRRGGRAC